MSDVERQVKEDVERLRALALRHGLDPPDVVFDTVSRRQMVEMGAYVLPYRFSHWTFGREYGRLQKFHDLGLIEILEMVVNADPARAFLVDTNTRTENRMVIAHVFGHADFFRNNTWFAKTNKRILDVEEYNERRVRALEQKHGQAAVERALDTALSIQWYVDFYGQFSRAGKPAPGEEERDLLRFLLENARLKPYEEEVLAMVREEAFYFLPNAMTKILNEGWSTYWHALLMREYLDFESFDQFAVRHSHLMMSQGLNPYKLGSMLLEDVARRWDEQHGRGAGHEKILDVRRFEDDVSLVRNYLTQDLCDRAGLFLYEEDPKTGEKTVTSTDVDDVRKSLVNELLNFGKPVIGVRSGDHNRVGELYLVHHYDGRELDLDYAADVLHNLYGFWHKPIHIETVVEEDRILLTYNGERASITKIGKWEKPRE